MKNEDRPPFAQGYGGLSGSPPSSAKATEDRSVRSAKKIICIVGPTASGKTALGIHLAKKFDGEIISADSRQIYKRLNIGTNKDLEEYDGVKHHLIDMCDPGTEFTLFDWLERARKTINEIFERGKLPIVVGGTGLYVKALIQGFKQTKNEKRKTYNRNEKVNHYSREELDGKTLKELQKIYSKFLILNSKFDLQNPRRLIREIERIQEGTCVSRQKPNFDALQIGIDIPRSVLYKKIDKKVEDWFSSGIIEEVRKLLASGVSSNWLKKIGLNYGLITEYLESSDDRVDKLKKEIKFKTHAYARRQLTWFHRFEEIKWVKSKKEAEKLVRNFLK